MNKRIKSLMSEIRTGLKNLYGPRLNGVYLYGSYARGDEDEESDLDVLVILEDFESYGAEVDRTSPLAASISLEYGVSISSVFLRERDWLRGESPFLDNVRREAIAA
ncbi:MAG: nucleotidyltransferase domain-containing protein [Gammaproteobacteria bacterium]